MKKKDEELLTLIKNSISQTLDNDGGGTPEGLLGLMARSGSMSLSDIPAVFECFSLLQHYLVNGAPVLDEDGLPSSSTIDFGRSVVIARMESTMFTLHLKIEPGDLLYTAHWCTASIKSETVLGMGGVYVIPFYIQEDVLFPDWCQAFFVDGKPAHCIPVIALRSIEALHPFEDGDFVNTALYRLSSYGLPVENALAEIDKKRAATNGA